MIMDTGRTVDKSEPVKSRMTRFRFRMALLISKPLIYILRKFDMGGTTLPGRVAAFICPGIAARLAQGFRIIMVTGTNGKTTTARIIGRILEENGITYAANRSGANLLSGITATLLEYKDCRGRNKVGTALLEVDEAAFNPVVREIKPDVLVVTNFFRDQLDRYGELYTTLRGVREGINGLNDTRLVLNADDSLCASLGTDTRLAACYYGFDAHTWNGNPETGNSDAIFCIYCKERYLYDYRTFAHLGAFKCPNCGYARPAAAVACPGVVSLTAEHSDIDISIDSVIYGARINLPGIYNIYNALAAASAAYVLGLPAEMTLKGLASFECGFGRMESIEAGGRWVKLILVKNPTGFNQVLDFLLAAENDLRLAFLINDNAADGRDISWLWDVDFEKLENAQDRIKSVYTSGLRAEDMAVRLKYAGVYSDRIIISKNYRELVTEALGNTPDGGILYLLPTYTAMLGIRKTLRRMFRLKEFWK